MKKLGLILGVLAFLLPLFLYLKTLAATYIPIDSAEFTMCMYAWGICHPPGFPLYVAVGHFFLKLVPFGTIIWRANLFSAVFGALSALVIYLSLLRLKVSEVTAFLLVMLLAASSTFWEFSLSADVFTFGTFLVAVAFYLAFLRRKYLAFFVLGLSASHFYLTAVLWPLFWWFFQDEPLNKFKLNRAVVVDFLLLGFIFALGFFPQAVMFWRMKNDPFVNWGHVKTVGDFINFVRRKEFGSGFLISNPSLLYSPVKNINQILAYFKSLLFEFGLILPISAILMFFVKTAENSKQFLFLFYSFLILVFVQLFLLSTIDPFSVNNPFQLNKFYLYSFVLVVLMVGLALESLRHKFFDENFYMIQFFVGLFAVIYLFANYKTHDLSGNRFTEKLISDMYSQLPQNSVVVTVDHVIFFGGLYEQVVNKKYQGVKILYFPNEHNNDQEAYHPELFGGVNQNFVGRIRKAFNLGGSEEKVLGDLSRMQNQDVYIALGDFEFQFFRFLNNETEPYGFWLHVKNDRQVTDERLISMFSHLQNAGDKKSDFNLFQQASETSIYSLGYYRSALELGKRGNWDGAISLFEKSLAVNDVGVSTGNDLELVKKIKNLMASYEVYRTGRDGLKLAELAEGLFTVGDWRDSVRVYEDLLLFEKTDSKAWANAASANASLGDIERARKYYHTALGLDPNLALARDGLAKLDNN